MKQKQGQIQVTFNWIYIVIAGAIILLFFVGLVVKQKASSEERLAFDVVDILESIFTGAGVSEKTKNFIDTSGLADYTLYFSCDPETGVGEYGIKDQSAAIQNAIDPLFAPAELQTAQLIIWSLPFNFPFKVIDFLLVTSANTKYYLVGSDQAFIFEFLDATDGFNREVIEDFSEIQPGNNFQIRIVDVGGSSIPLRGVPESLQSLADQRVTAVVLTVGQAAYYQKNGANWRQLSRVQTISLPGERDAAKYAAIFAEDGEMYTCNMNKAFKRLKYLAEIYGGKEIASQGLGGKLGDLHAYYKDTVPTVECFNIIENRGQGYMGSFQNKINICLDNSLRCPDLIGAAGELKDFNQILGEGSREACIPLY